MAKSRAGEWFRRYAPAEVGAILGAVLAAIAVDQFGLAAATAYAGAIGEAVVFYGVLFVRDLSAHRAGRSPGRAVGRTVRDLVLECGPAELLDTLAVRPLAMYLATQAVGSAWLGGVLGKIAADGVFYTVAIIGYEIRKSAVRTPPPVRAGTMPATDPLAPQAPDRLEHPTPFLVVDLDRVRLAYLDLADGLGVDAIHYAVKCNPDPHVLA